MLNPYAFPMWFSRPLSEKRQEMLRSKGIMDRAGDEQCHVIQGVHVLMNGDLLWPWPADKKREAKLVRRPQP